MLSRHLHLIGTRVPCQQGELTFLCECTLQRPSAWRRRRLRRLGKKPFNDRWMNTKPDKSKMSTNSNARRREELQLKKKQPWLKSAQARSKNQCKHQTAWCTQNRRSMPCPHIKYQTKNRMHTWQDVNAKPAQKGTKKNRMHTWQNVHDRLPSLGRRGENRAHTWQDVEDESANELR